MYVQLTLDSALEAVMDALIARLAALNEAALADIVQFDGDDHGANPLDYGDIRFAGHYFRK